MADSGDYDRALWPDWVQVGDVVYPPGGVLGPRIQQSLQLVMIHSGEMTVWVDATPYHAPAATVTLLFPGHEERFAFAASSETYHSYVHIHLAHLPHTLHQRLLALPRTLPLSSALADLTTKALALRTSTLSTARPLLKAICVQMLWRYMGEGERALSGMSGPSLHPAVEQARQYIRAHLSEPLTLETLANVGAVSPSHLIRLFQSELNTTPIAYLWEQRIQQGIEMLETTGLTVSTIAERCGFQTSYHFSRRVRQATGLSPLAVRRRAWGQA
jgi:AraC-like DNA-binding protein